MTKRTPLPDIYPRVKETSIYPDLYKNSHSSLIRNYWNRKHLRCWSTGKWINKLWYIHRIACDSANKKGQTVNTNNIVNESQNHYVVYKKPDNKGYILYVLYDTISIKL